MKLLKILLEISHNDKFDEVLEKQRLYNSNYEDDLIDIGLLRNKTLKKIEEFETLTGIKLNILWIENP